MTIIIIIQFVYALILVFIKIDILLYNYRLQNEKKDSSTNSTLEVLESDNLMSILLVLENKPSY